MTATQLLLSVLSTLERTRTRLEDFDLTHCELDTQISIIERSMQEFLHVEDSPMVARVRALEQLERVQQYLYRATYASDGYGTAGWSHWYDDIASAMELLRNADVELRDEIANRIINQGKTTGNL